MSSKSTSQSAANTKLQDAISSSLPSAETHSSNANKSRVYLNLALALDDSDDDDYDEEAALEMYAKLIALGFSDANTETALCNRALIHRNRKQYDLAVADYSAAIATSQSHTDFWYRSLLYREMRRYDLELADIQNAISQATDTDETYLPDCHARMSVLTRMRRKRNASPSRALDPTDLYESHTTSISQATAVKQQLSQAITAVKKLKSELAGENNHFAEITRRQFDQKKMENVLRKVLQSQGGGFWFVNDLISIIAGYAMRIEGRVATCCDRPRV